MAALPSLLRQRWRDSPLTDHESGRLSFPLSSTMESVSEVEAAAEKFAAEAGLDEDETFPHDDGRARSRRQCCAARERLRSRQTDRRASFENTGKRLVILIIADQGKGLDPDIFPTPGARKPFARHRPRHLPDPVSHG